MPLSSTRRYQDFHLGSQSLGRLRERRRSAFKRTAKRESPPKRSPTDGLAQDDQIACASSRKGMSDVGVRRPRKAQSNAVSCDAQENCRSPKTTVVGYQKKSRKGSHTRNSCAGSDLTATP